LAAGGAITAGPPMPLVPAAPPDRQRRTHL